MGYLQLTFVKAVQKHCDRLIVGKPVVEKGVPKNSVDEIPFIAVFSKIDGNAMTFGTFILRGLNDSVGLSNARLTEQNQAGRFSDIGKRNEFRVEMAALVSLRIREKSIIAV